MGRSSRIEDVKYIAGKKNEFYSKKENLKEKIGEYTERRTEVEESISRMPEDLPEELQSQMNTAIENVRVEFKRDAKEIGEEADDARNEADDIIDTARNSGNDWKQKAEKIRRISSVPIIGRFMESKADELNERAEDMFDLARETQQYQDELSLERNKLYENR